MENYNTGYVPNLSERIETAPHPSIGGPSDTSNSTANTETALTPVIETIGFYPRRGNSTFQFSAYLRNSSWFRLGFSFQPYISDPKVGEYWEYIGLLIPDLGKELNGTYHSITEEPHYSGLIVQDHSFDIFVLATHQQKTFYEMFPLYQSKSNRSLYIEEYTPIEI